MKNYELTIHVDEEEILIFIQPGFFEHQNVTTSLHRHQYAEVQLVEQGSVEYLIGDQHITAKAGELVVIPAMTFHKCYPPAEPVRCIPFQLDKDFSEPAVYPSIPGIFTKLLEEINHTKHTEDCGRISAYLTQICSIFLCSKRQKFLPVQDKRFIIHEFFSHNYEKNISLADIARELNLSPRQTERLIIKYTGNTFRQELSRQRIEAARHLLATEELPLEEVAALVGYRSYSGFWKALNKNSVC